MPSYFFWSRLTWFAKGNWENVNPSDSRTQKCLDEPVDPTHDMRTHGQTRQSYAWHAFEHFLRWLRPEIIFCFLFLEKKCICNEILQHWTCSQVLKSSKLQSAHINLDDGFTANLSVGGLGFFYDFVSSWPFLPPRDNIHALSNGRLK